MLPPGQRPSTEFPRFGLDAFARRFPQTQAIDIEVGGAISTPLQVTAAFTALPRRQQTSDFHCVTTWSVQELEWEGFRAQLPLGDLLANDVLLADRVNGEPLSVAMVVSTSGAFDNSEV